VNAEWTPVTLRTKGRAQHVWRSLAHALTFSNVMSFNAVGATNYARNFVNPGQMPFPSRRRHLLGHKVFPSEVLISMPLGLPKTSVIMSVNNRIVAMSC
jgi:hypothetical protein